MVGILASQVFVFSIIAAISLCLNKSKITKSTQPDVQVLAKKDDRLRVVKMKSEEKED